MGSLLPIITLGISVIISLLPIITIITHYYVFVTEQLADGIQRHAPPNPAGEQREQSCSAAEVGVAKGWRRVSVAAWTV